MPAGRDTYRSTVEKFIGLIRANPVVYDTSLPEHRDSDVLNDVWTWISNAMGSSSTEADGWKKKWRNLRDTYVKQVRNARLAKTDPSTTKKRPWRFTKFMKFLDSFIEHKSNTLLPPQSFDDDNGSNVTSDRLEDDSDSYTERSSVNSAGSQRPVKRQKVEPPYSPSPSITETHVLPQNISANNERYPDDSVNDRYLTDLFANVKRKQEHRFAPAEDTDGDEAFFESCAHRMRKLPARTRSFLKLQITQLFVNAENQDIPPLPITPLPLHQSTEHT